MRSIPNSRVRWATVIAKVLKIRKAPTKTVIPAKISSAVVRKPKPSLMSWASSLATCSPVLTSTLVGQRGAEPIAQLLGADAVGGLDRDLVELALLAGDPLRLGQRELGQAGAAERHAGAELRDPASACTRVSPRAPVIGIVWPTS